MSDVGFPGLSPFNLALILGYPACLALLSALRCLTARGPSRLLAIATLILALWLLAPFAFDESAWISGFPVALEQMSHQAGPWLWLLPLALPFGLSAIARGHRLRALDAAHACLLAALAALWLVP